MKKTNAPRVANAHKSPPMQSVGSGSSGSAFLTSDEEERLVMACIATGPKTEQEATRVLEWAHETRLRSEMLTMVLEGKLLVGVTADDLTFTTQPIENMKTSTARKTSAQRAARLVASGAMVRRMDPHRFTAGQRVQYRNHVADYDIALLEVQSVDNGLVVASRFFDKSKTFEFTPDGLATWSPNLSIQPA